MARSKSAPTPIPTPSETDRYLGPTYKKETDSKFKQHDFLIYAVLIIVGITLIGIVVATTNMYLDQAHYNNDTYKEQSGEFQTQLNNLQTQVNILKNKK